MLQFWWSEMLAFWQRKLCANLSDSEGLLAYDIAMRIIVTCDECISTSASNSCTTNLQALPPYYLGIMEAILVVSTCICLVVVVTFLFSPSSNSITSFPVLATAPKQILAVIAIRMNQCTIFLSLMSPGWSKICKLLAPSKRSES